MAKPNTLLSFTDQFRADALVELIDVSSTIVDFAGAPPPDSCCGRSLEPIVAGTSSAVRDAALIECAHHHCIVTTRRKAQFDPHEQLAMLFDAHDGVDRRRRRRGSLSRASEARSAGDRRPRIARSRAAGGVRRRSDA